MNDVTMAGIRLQPLLFLRARSVLEGPAVAAILLGIALSAAASSTLSIEHWETTGIDGRSPDGTFPNALVFDAVHRSLLLRFPGSAAAIEAALGARRVSRATLTLDYDGYETNPVGYMNRPALGESMWKSNPPKWHVVAWALRRPWAAGAQGGPTYNAVSRDAAYWSRYGAADSLNDRYDQRFGPEELSSSHPTATLDVTAVFSDVRYGTFADRARLVESSGFILAKLETYDSRYRQLNDAYEWAMPTGGHGLKVRSARLEIAFDDSPPSRTRIAAAPSPAAQSVPTAVVIDRREFERLATSRSLNAAPMNAAQRTRIAELARVGGGLVGSWMQMIEAKDYTRYRTMLSNEILAVPPRFWRGWAIEDDLLIWHLYRPLLPEFVQDHMKRYWEAWLMPDTPTSEFFHPQSVEAIDYWKRTGDWRGRASFFRAGYNYTTSTENFNHTAAMGALLGGAMIGSEYAMADGRNGLERYPLRLWSMWDGSTQEMLDHYYFSITLSAQKMFADFGPTQTDRLMGRVILDRSLELLTAAYHPNLRRMIGPSGRARLSGVLVEQDGIYGVLHTMSSHGVLKYVDRSFDAKVNGMPVWGYDFPPGRVAVQTLAGPWGDERWTRAIDEKPLPFEETAKETTRNLFNPPLWRRTYLGRHYGLASQDVKGGTVDLLAQWNSRAEDSKSMEDLGTLTMRYAVNEPDMATTRGGTMPQAGGMLTLQHRNKAIVVTKPRTERDRTIALAGATGLKALSSVIALWNFRHDPGWDIRVEGTPLPDIPASIAAGRLITIRDGVTYLGIIPLHATNLGRDEEVVIGHGGGGKSEPNAAPISPSLLIRSFNLQSGTPIEPDEEQWKRITGASYGGFVVEIGDEAEFGSYESFLSHMRGAVLVEKWDPARELVEVSYRSGDDLLEMGIVTRFDQADVHYGIVPGQQTKAFAYRRVNGQWPYLPSGIERDTTVAQQGTAGRLEKNGAVLVTDPGRKAYLQTEPLSGIYTGYNPLPDPTAWSMSVPGGIRIEAQGKVGLLRVTVTPRTNHIAVDYAPKVGQDGPAMAKTLIVTGSRARPVVTLNGVARETETILDTKAGQFLIPLH
jgi:hypothetical protein